MDEVLGVRDHGDGDEEMMDLDTANKFGIPTHIAGKILPPTSTSTTSTTAIPDPMLVTAIKQRRREAAERAAAGANDEEDYISLTSSKKEKSSRLVKPEFLDPDADPELAAFTDTPSRLAFTSTIASDHAAARNLARRGEIQNALHVLASDEEDDDDDDVDSQGNSIHSDDDDQPEKSADWEEEQLRRTGASNLAAARNPDDPTSSIEARLRYVPSKIPPVVGLEEVVKKFEGLLSEAVERRERTLKRVGEVRREREGLERREREVQAELERVGKEYAKLSEGLDLEKKKEVPAQVERGLESLAG